MDFSLFLSHNRVATVRTPSNSIMKIGSGLVVPALPMYAGMPRWSPDGKKIVFFGGDPEHPARLYVISSDGGTPRLLAAGEFQAVSPSWMADGNSIVFVDTKGGEATGMVKMINVNTSQVTAVRTRRPCSLRLLLTTVAILPVPALTAKPCGSLTSVPANGRNCSKRM
jgi:tricorn protease-like protein